MRLDTWRGDLTTLVVDAIVNAANEALAPGGGVCGAIHAAAGPQLAEECRALGGCATGDAVATRGYQLLARWVIHAVGPVWNGGSSGEVDLLASTYRRSIEVAEEVGAASIAFPAISTGIFGFPLELATHTAVSTLAELSPEHVERCVLVAYDAATLEVLDATVARLGR